MDIRKGYSRIRSKFSNYSTAMFSEEMPLCSRSIREHWGRNISLNKEAEFSFETLLRIYQNAGHNVLEKRMSHEEI